MLLHPVNRMIRARSVLLTSALVAGAAGCTSEAAHPPALDCDAMCGSIAVGTGVVSRPPTDGGADSGEGEADSATDAATLGLADLTLAMFSTACAACVVQNCPGADRTCSTDTLCPGLLQCVAGGCTDAGPCTANVCAMNFPNDVAPYNELAACMQALCTSPTCPPLPLANDF